MEHIFTKEEFEQYSLEKWQESTKPYDGKDSIDSLLNFLELSIVENREFLLYTNNPLSHLHECWIFFQFVTGALGFYTNNGVIFADHWRNIYRVHHVAKLIGANDLAKSLEEGIKQLEKIPTSLLNEYESNLLSDAVEQGKASEETVDTATHYLEMAYDDAVSKGQISLVPSFTVIGNGEYPILDAFASYMDSLRNGAPMKPMGASEDEATSIEEQFAPHRERFKRLAHYESLGHKNIRYLVTTDPDGNKERFLKKLSELGHRVSSNPLRGRSDRSSKGDVSLRCIITELGEKFAIVGFLDGEMLVRLKDQKEIDRVYFKKEENPRLDSEPMRMRRRPDIYIKPEDFTVHHVTGDERIKRKIKYSKKLYLAPSSLIRDTLNIQHYIDTINKTVKLYLLAVLICILNYVTLKELNPHFFIDILKLSLLTASLANLLYVWIALPRKIFGWRHLSILSISMLLTISISTSTNSLDSILLFSCLTLYFFSLELALLLRVCRYIKMKKDHPEHLYKSFLLYFIYPNYSYGFTSKSKAAEAIETIIKHRKGNPELALNLCRTLNKLRYSKDKDKIKKMNLSDFKKYLLKSESELRSKDVDTFFDLKIN